MPSQRAAEVAEVLWELKRAGKVATYSTIARRAGFSPGANGRNMASCLKTVRRDWPHLQWWRAISDDCVVPEDSEHNKKLRESGFELEVADEQQGLLTLKAPEDQLMSWEQDQQAE